MRMSRLKRNLTSIVPVGIEGCCTQLHRPGISITLISIKTWLNKLYKQDVDDLFYMKFLL